MPWAALPPDLHIDPSAVEAGAEALGLFAFVRSWLSQALTDGRIPRATALSHARMLDLRDPEAPETGAFARLVASGLWAVDGRGFSDVRWLENNASKDRVNEKRTLTKKRTAEWRAKNTKGANMSDGNASQTHSNASLTRESRGGDGAAHAQTHAQTQTQNPEARVPAGGRAGGPAHVRESEPGARTGVSSELGAETETAKPQRSAGAGPSRPLAGRTGRSIPAETVRPVNGHAGAKASGTDPTETPTPLRGPLPQPAAEPEGDPVEVGEAAPPTAEQKRLARLAGYAAHYSAGVASVTGAPHVVAQPHELDKFALITTRYAQRDDKALKGPELSDWLRALGAEYAAATQHAAQYQRGYAPSKCLEWLGAGRPKGPRSTGAASSAGGAGWARL